MRDDSSESEGSVSSGIWAVDVTVAVSANSVARAALATISMVLAF